MLKKSSDEMSVPGKTPGSVAFGLWMLLSGVPTTIWSAWQGNGGFSPLPAAATVLGALLVLEPRGAVESPLANSESLIEVVPGMLMKPDLTTAPPRLMPIWLHLIVQAVASILGFFGGAIVGAGTYGMLMTTAVAVAGWDHANGRADEVLIGICSLVVVALCFFGGAALGLAHAQRLFQRYVPARCPRCKGDSYCRNGSPIIYRCRLCGHVHETIWHMKGYKGRP